MTQDIWLYPTPAVQEYMKRRQRVGNDPFPNPETEREEIVHRLWLMSVTVAGWWLEETSVLRDILQKAEVTQKAEAERMEKEAAERIRRSLLLPTQAQISERLRDIWSFNKAKREGRRQVYAGSGTQSL